MFSRLTLAVGSLGVGALAFVGVGSYASFTSSVGLNNSITTGTFQLEAQPTGTPTVAGPLAWAQQPAAQATQTQSATAEPTVTGEGNTLSYSLTNAAPGDTYTYQFTVYDVGTLQGQVNTITYNPVNRNALEQNMTIEVLEDVNGTWTPVHTSDSSGAPGTPQNAAYPYTFYLDYSFGPNFLQPTKLVNGQPTYTGEEGSVTYRVVFGINSSATNSVEGASASPTLTVNGVNTP